MEQFSLEKYLENPSRNVVTRDGREVDIYYSPTSRIHLIGRTSDNEIHQYTKDGFQCDTFNQAKNDLFFADEEETLSTFLTELKSYLANTPREQIEKDWKEIQDWYNQHCADESNNEEQLTEFEQGIKTWMSEFLLGTEQSVPDETVKKAAQKVLDLARKELQPEFDKELDEAYKSRDEVVYLEGYDTGCEDTLESLPKWKKATKPKNFDNHIILFKDKDRVILTTEIYEDEYYIELDDLKSLPKEE